MFVGMNRICEIIAIAGLVALMLCSCRSVRYIAGPVTHDTLRITRIAHDTLHIRDSIRVDREVRGDTVRITTDRWHNVIKKVEVRDTVYKAKTDTVHIPVPVEKKSWYERTIAPIVDGVITGFFFLIVVILVVVQIKEIRNGREYYKRNRS